MVSLLGSYLSRGRVWSAFVRVIGGKSKKEKKKEVAIKGKEILYLFWFVSNMRRFQVYSKRSYLFYALDMINIFPSANFPGHLKDGAVQGGQPAGQRQTDFEIDL